MLLSGRRVDIRFPEIALYRWARRSIYERDVAVKVYLHLASMAVKALY
jgi:hypothetical protein